MLRAALLLLICLAVALPAQARVAEPEPTSLKLSVPFTRMEPKLGHPFLPLGLAGGGADGVVSGPTRTLGWLLLGIGAGAAVGGGWLLRENEDGKMGLAGTLLGVGAGGIIAGGLLIWTTGCVSCATCGIVENTRPDKRLREAVAASADPKRKSDKGKRIPIFAMRF